MTQLSVRDFRNKMAGAFDRVDAGEFVYIRRRNQLYSLVPVRDPEAVMETSLAEKLEKARQEYREGRTLKFENAAAAQKWMDEL